MNSLTVLLTSCHQKDLTINCIESYLKFCPSDLDLKIVLVENSSDTSYKDEVMALSNKITWINNNTSYIGSDALSQAIEIGMESVEDDYVFLSHNDICIVSDCFFKSLREKQREGYELIGMCSDIHPLRNHCIIVLGCLVKSEIVRKVDLYQLPNPDGTPRFECGDRVNIYCRENNIKHICFDNTHNNPELAKTLPEPFKSLNYVVRTVDDKGNVIFLHFARGFAKATGYYNKSGRLTVSEIIKWCEKNVLNKT